MTAATRRADTGQHACAPGWLGDDLGLWLQGELAHADEVLCNLREALLVLVDEELGPMRQVLVHLL